MLARDHDRSRDREAVAIAVLLPHPSPLPSKPERGDQRLFENYYDSLTVTVTKGEKDSRTAPQFFGNSIWPYRSEADTQLRSCLRRCVERHLEPIPIGPLDSVGCKAAGGTQIVSTCSSTSSTTCVSPTTFRSTSILRVPIGIGS